MAWERREGQHLSANDAGSVQRWAVKLAALTMPGSQAWDQARLVPLGTTRRCASLAICGPLTGCRGTETTPGAETPELSWPGGTTAASADDRPLDGQSREWFWCLADDGQDGRRQIERESCLLRLHGMLVRVARAEVRRRSASASIDGHEQEDLVYRAADDAMLAIIKKLGQFRGESRFTTWAYRFAVLEVSNQLGRHFRQQVTVQIEDELWERIPDRLGIDPARHAESVELADALRAAVAGALSERQRHVFVALVVEGVPLDTLAAELGSTRNAIYKMMFDARQKIRAHLVAHGYLREDRPHVSGKPDLDHGYDRGPAIAGPRCLSVTLAGIGSLAGSGPG